MSDKQKFILPGSFEVQAGVMCCGVFVGTHDFDINDSLRYVKGVIVNAPDSCKSGEDYAFWLYDNSSGCCLDGTFEINE